MLTKALALFLALTGFGSGIGSLYFWLKSDRRQGIEPLSLTLLTSALAVVLAIFACVT